MGIIHWSWMVLWLCYLWGGGGDGGRGGGWRSEQTAGQVQRDVVLVAAHDPEEVEPQRFQSGVLQCIQLSGHLVGKTFAVIKKWELELINRKLWLYIDQDVEEIFPITFKFPINGLELTK